MAGETTLTIVGNLTGAPELRFTAAGAAVCNFSVASTPRTFDRSSQQWSDGDTLFMRCTVWQGAEQVAESLSRGDRVVVTGRLQPRSYEKDGQRHTVLELIAEEVGVSLRYAVARPQRIPRSVPAPV